MEHSRNRNDELCHSEHGTVYCMHYIVSFCIVCHVGEAYPLIIARFISYAPAVSKVTFKEIRSDFSSNVRHIDKTR